MNSGAIADNYPQTGAIALMLVGIFAFIGLCVVIARIVEFYKEHKK